MWPMVCSKAVVLLLIHCLLFKLPLFVGVLYLVLVLFCSTLVSFLVLQSSRWERKSWLLYFNCLFDVMWLFKCSVSLRYGAVGLQCVIMALSWSYTLSFFNYARL